MKRFFKYLFRTILAIVILLILIVVLLYLPPVQNFVRKQAIKYVTANYGLDVRIGKLSVGFPLDVRLEGVYAGKTPADTLVALKSLRLNVGLRHVFQSRLALSELLLEKVKFVLPGDSTATRLNVDVAKLDLRAGEVHLKKKTIKAGNILLEDGFVILTAGQNVMPDTAKNAPIDWTFGVGQIDLKNVGFQMTSAAMPYLKAGIAAGQISEGAVSLGHQTVDVGKLMLDEAWCDMKTAAGGQGENTSEVMPVGADTLRSLWTVKAGSLYMKNSAYTLASDKEKQTALVLSGIAVQVDSVYNRGTVVRAALRDLQVVQQNGIRVRNMQAEVNLDTAETSLGKVYIRTQNSTINVNVRSNTSVSGLFKEIPLDVTLDAQLGIADIEPFYPNIPREIRNKSLKVKTAFSYAARRVKVSRLAASMPGHFDLSGQGDLSSFQELKAISGNFNIRGTFPNITFLNDFLKGTGVNVPRNLTFTADLKALNGVLDIAGRLCRSAGCLTVDANYSVPTEIYNASLLLSDFPLNSFLPADSLGKLSAEFRVAGRNFHFAEAEAEIKAEIHEFEYKKHPYQDIRLDASLQQTRLRGNIESTDPYAKFKLSFSGDSVGSAYQAVVKGEIEKADLKELHLIDHQLAVGLGIDIRASQGKENAYAFRMALDSIYMTDSVRRYELGDIVLDMESGREATTLGIKSGDFVLSSRIDTALVTAVSMFGVAVNEISRQIAHWDVDMEKVDPYFPEFSLDIHSGQKNVVARYLKARNIGFQKLTVETSAKREKGLRFTTRIDAPYYGNVKLDSVSFSGWQRDQGLAYLLTVGGSTDEKKGPFSVNAMGNIAGDRLQMELKQKDGKGDIGFDFGMGLTMGDSVFSLNLFPITPILGYRRWIVNSDNKIEIRKGGKVEADMRLSYADKLISIQSLGDEGDLKDRLKIEIKGVDLAALTRLLPFSPDLAGQLNTDLLLYSRDDALGANGNILIREFYYQQQRIGTIDLGMQYSLGQHFSDHAIDFELKLDSLRRAVAKGEFSTSEENKDIFVDMNITDFPLYAVNAFMPNNLLNLQGYLAGDVRFRGTVDAPELDGNLAFHDGRAELLMIGTTFGLDTAHISIRNNKIIFNRFRFIAPNQSALTVNGNINLMPFDRMGADLTVSGNNFQIVNVKQNPSSIVFGKAYIDLNARLAGAFSALSVTGNVNLLNNTAITYTLRSADPELQDRSVDLVRFVSFRDSTLNEKDDLTNRVKVNNFMLKMLVEIGENVSMSVYLSEDGQNNVEIKGGGNLILAMNPESGLTLAGKYILTDGTVTYNVPVAGKKVFNIQSGSFVEWTGDVINPRLSISANEQVKATVEDGDRNRLVTFESIIRIQNTLSQPEITFDLSAPNDMVIQNQLATFSPEERTKQAMNLLIYGTYTGPGSTSSAGGNMANNALYGFVENELNKYTRKTGLTFGFDSYNTNSETTRTDFTYQFSKQLFNDKVSVKIGGRVSSDNNENNGDNNLQDNLVDDISIEYRFTKKRNLFLKVFRHSNYESVLEGEVTQTGIGIVWRKSFRKVRDLFIRKAKQEAAVKENQETVKEK